MKNYFSALWFWAWFIMWCLHCKNPESLQILSVLPLLLNVRLVSLQIPVWVQAAVYSQQKKPPKNWVCSFLIQLRPGDFVSHWLEVNLPSVVKRCQKNRWSLPKCMQTRWQKYRSYTRIISQQYHTASFASPDGFGTFALGIRAPSFRMRCEIMSLCNWQKHFNI